MNPSDNNAVRTRTLSPREAVDHAHALLESVLTATGEDIDAVGKQFERLAQEVQKVLDLTSGIVDCVQQEWIVSIVPMTRALASSARRFIEERVDSLAAISTVFAGESKMLEKLLSLAAEQRSIAREGWTLRILASIEVARMAGAGIRFECMAHELEEFSAMVSSGVMEMQTEAERRRITLTERRCKLNRTLRRRTEYFNSIEVELSAAIAALDAALVEFARIPADFQRFVALVAANISRVVEAVQVQDITRQQTEHVRDILSRISSEFENCNGPRSEVQRNAILKIQACQVQSACTSTKEWINELIQCLESILRVGSSDVLAIGTAILEQQRGLTLQLARIERLEQECAADDVEVEASLAGIGDLMRITKIHLSRSRLARDRMQLLNFNSMIEASHLEQATALLEITRNIGRLAAGWSALTDRSGDTLEAMLSSSANAEQAHRNKTRLNIENLRRARHDSDAALAALSQAAAITESNGEKVKAAVAGMHDESNTLGRIAERLAHSIALMEEAKEQIQQAEKAVAPSAPPLTHDDLLRIESECLAIYSSELERSILRAELVGDEMALPGAAVTSHDVELF